MQKRPVVWKNSCSLHRHGQLGFGNKVYLLATKANNGIVAARKAFVVDMLIEHYLELLACKFLFCFVLVINVEIHMVARSLFSFLALVHKLPQ